MTSHVTSSKSSTRRGELDAGVSREPAGSTGGKALDLHCLMCLADVGNHHVQQCVITGHVRAVLSLTVKLVAQSSERFGLSNCRRFNTSSTCLALAQP